MTYNITRFRPEPDTVNAAAGLLAAFMAGCFAAVAVLMLASPVPADDGVCELPVGPDGIGYLLRVLPGPDATL